MKIEDLDGFIALCQQKVDALKVSFPEIDSIVAQHLVVLIAGVYEETIEESIRARAEKSKDIALVNLVTSLVDETFRNPDSKNVKRLIKRFGKAAVDELSGKVKLEDAEALNSIILNKNAIAHGKDSPVTIKDVENYYAKSRVVIHAVNEIVRGG